MISIIRSPISPRSTSESKGKWFVRTMSPTESSLCGGIIDGEGHVEFKWANRTRKDRKGSPTYRTLNCPAGSSSSRQTTDRLVNGDNQGRNTGHQTLSHSSNLERSTSLARRLSWRLPSAQAGLPLFNCEEAKSKTGY